MLEPSVAVTSRMTLMSSHAIELSVAVTSGMTLMSSHARTQCSRDQWHDTDV